MSENNKSGIDIAFKVFSLVSIFLLICGITYSYFFYRNFGITITEYIEINEAILLFVPLLANGTFLILIFVIILHIGNRILLFRFPIDIKKLNEQIQMRKAAIQIFIVTLVVIAIVYILCLIGIFGHRVLYLLIVLAIAWSFPSITEMVYYSLNRHLQLNVSETFRDILYILIVAMSISLYQSYSKTQRINRKWSVSQFKMQFNNGDTTYESDSNSYYLGRTSNYIFIYDYSLSRTKVFNVTDVKIFTSSKQ